MKPIIKVENISKQYHIGATQVGKKNLREAFSDLTTSPLQQFRKLGRSNTETIWALKNFSFEAQPGEVIGFIGANGAGKSTLLKILSRITEPSAGRIELYGRVGSLLEVGTGFHPELSGRENVYLNGAILGMKRTEINRKFDEIVSFSEIEKFLDTPVKYYSSGMYMRLAFSVAAHLDPEILIVDEVLAVGDAAFQQKCLGKMGNEAKAGRTVLFVSHNITAVLQLCNRGIVIDQGQCQWDGDVSTAVSLYRSEMKTIYNEVKFDLEPDKPMQIISMSVTSSSGEVIHLLPHTKPFVLTVEYRVDQWSAGSYVCVDVFNQTDNRILWSSDVSTVDEMKLKRPAGTYVACVTIPGMILAPGRYYFTAAIVAPEGQKVFDARSRAVAVEISDGGSLLSNFGIKPHAATMIPLSWETKRSDGENRA